MLEDTNSLDGAHIMQINFLAKLFNVYFILVTIRLFKLFLLLLSDTASKCAFVTFIQFLDLLLMYS